MRTCDRCGSRMSPFLPRKRSGDELVCNGCKEIEERMMAQADINKTANIERTIQQINAETDHQVLLHALDQNQRLRELGVSAEYQPILDAQDEALKERLSELGTKQGSDNGLQRNLDWTTCFHCGERIHEIENPVPGLDVERRGDLLFRHSRSGSVQCADGQHVATPKGSRPVEGAHQGHGHIDLDYAYADAQRAVAKLGVKLRRFAHDSGDGETIYHCPFCGAGQVIARSDGTAQCQFCDTAFTVQVQPSMKSVPQTIDGEPHVHPDMPGDEPGTVPEEEEPEEQAEEMDLEPSEEEDQRPNPFTTGSRITGYYLAEDGAVLPEESYIRHLAIQHADDRDAVVEAVKRSREQ